jgi:hypothetical protein
MTANPNRANTLAIAAVADSLAPETSAARSEVIPLRSHGQHLLDRFNDQCNRILQVHRRLVEVRGGIVATPAPSVALAEVKEPKSKGVAFFAGLGVVADASDAAIAALELDVDELAKLF